MNFFIKLFKTLNSAQKPWQITLAIVLGMLMGLTPLSGIQTILILLIAFIVNIHLGFFFLMAAQFAAIGYLFDPLFDQFGFWLLHLEGLKDFWTASYNSGLMRLTYFNNSIVLGSTAVALLLALPLYILINKLLTVYRERIMVYCAQNRWLNKFGFFNQPTKKEGAIRWWGAGLFVVISALAVVVVSLFLDGWLKTAVEKGLGVALDKRVFVKNLELSWFEAQLSINGLMIEGERPDHSAVTLGKIKTDLDMNALILGKTHIDTVEISGMRFDEPTDVFAKLEKQEKKAEAAAEQEARAEAAQEARAQSADSTSGMMDSITLPSVDDVLKNSDLQSKKSFDSAQARIDSIVDKWKTIEEKVSHDPTNQEIERDFKKLKEMSKNLKLENVKTFKTELDRFKEKVNRQKNYYQELKKDFEKDKTEIAQLIEQVKKAKNSDYASIKGKYTLNKQGGINLLGAFLGPKIQGYAQTASDAYEKVAPYLKSEDANVTAAVIDRHKGRIVKFKEYIPQPDLLILQTKIEGLYEGQSFNAQIKDITNDQKLLGKAITFSLSSDGVKAKGLTLKGYDDRRGKTVTDHIDLSIKSLPEVKLNLALVKLHKSALALNATVDLLDQEKLTADAKLRFTQSELTAGKIKGSVGNALNADLKKVKTFNATVKADGTLTSPNVKVNSELTAIMKKSLDNYVKAQLKAFEAKLSAKLEALTQEQLQKLRDKNKNFAQIEALLSKDSKVIDDLKNNAGALKVEPSQAQKKALENKAKEKLRNLLNF